MTVSVEMHRARTGATGSLCLLILMVSQVADADRVPYRFVSIHSQNVPIGSMATQSGAINNLGVVAMCLNNFTSTIRTVDGSTATDIDFSDNFSFSCGDINDSGQIAVLRTSFNGVEQRVRRYESDGSFVDLATGLSGCAAGEFCEFDRPAINNAGQVATKATLNVAGVPTLTLHRFDELGPVEIVQQDASAGGLIGFGGPSINDAGIVAFNAAQAGLGGIHWYTGMGGAAPVLQGTVVPAGGGGSGTHSAINNNGQIASSAGNGVFLIQSGVVQTVVAPQTGGIFNHIGGNMAINNLGDLVFVSAEDTSGCIDWALFTGGDEVNDVVLRTGESVFDGVVNTGCGPNGSPIRMGPHALNDLGEVVFVVETLVDTGFKSHVVRAIPLSPAFDSEEDGVANDVDNCLVEANPMQLDSDADGFGNMCDPDLNNDGVTNVQDLGLMRIEFFGNDPDADFNGDGIVNIIDLGIMKALFNQVPGPSALAE